MPTPKVWLFCKLFGVNERIWTRGKWGARPWSLPWIRQWYWYKTYVFLFSCTYVYFKVAITDGQTFPQNSPILWGHLQKNVGNGYNASSGKSVAPQAGTYRFTATVMNKNPSDLAYMSLKKNDVALCSSCWRPHTPDRSMQPSGAAHSQRGGLGDEPGLVRGRRLSPCLHHVRRIYDTWGYLNYHNIW